jgi:hypothetical protein
MQINHMLPLELAHQLMNTAMLLSLKVKMKLTDINGANMGGNQLKGTNIEGIC